MRTGIVRDARGRTVNQLDPYQMHVLHRHDVIEPDALRSIAREIGSGLTPGQRKALRVLGIGWGLVAIVFLIRCIEVVVTGRWGELLDTNMAIWFNLWFWPMIVWHRATEARGRRTTTVMLEHIRCPHCGYDLTGLHVDPADGATVCPECGSAWMIRTPAGSQTVS